MEPGAVRRAGLRLDLQILLPHVPDKADACVGRLIRELEGRGGIEQVHVRDGEDGTSAQVCIHYDAEMLPLARIREIVEGAGAAISGRYGHASWEVDGIVSLGIVAFLVPATIFGLGIGPAVAIHEGSTLLVVFNALRLLAYRDSRAA